METIEAIRASPDGPTIPWVLLERLHELIPAVETTFVQMDYARRCFTSHQGIVDGRRFFLNSEHTPNALWWKVSADSADPSGLNDARAGQILRWSAHFSTMEIKAWPLYQEYWQGAGDSIRVEFPAPALHTRRLLLWRDGHDRFTDSDEALIRLLRPHLFELDRDVRRPPGGAQRLTERQSQVLQLMAEGRSNAEIASLLVVSVATVRKHVEHILLSAQVHSRGAAVAKLLPMGLD